jgi:small subunit ribosomal protein S17
MAQNTKKKINKKEEKTESVKCSDKLCPFHGKEKLRMRGRVFQGNVIRKFTGRVTIQFERMISIPKYERYEKRKTKIHARLPECMNEIAVGDLIEVSETRPISKTIHFVVSKMIKKLSNGAQE